MAVQTPAAPRRPDPGVAPSSRFRVAAILFWIGAVLVGLLGAVVTFGFVADAGAAFDLWFLVLAVPFGLLLGAAMVTTRKAKGRRGAPLAVLLLSLIAAIALHGIVRAGGTPNGELTTAQACSAEELVVLEAQSFYSDIDGSPAGTQFDSCYVMLTVEGTGQQACRRRPKSARRLAPQRAKGLSPPVGPSGVGCERPTLGMLGRCRAT